MLSQQEKAYRYDVIENAIRAKIDEIIDCLCYDNNCSESQISLGELESNIQENIKDQADLLFGDDITAYYLIDFIVSELTDIPPYSLNPFKKRKAH